MGHILIVFPSNSKASEAPPFKGFDLFVPVSVRVPTTLRFFDTAIWNQLR